jgi:hypothetical protein
MEQPRSTALRDACHTTARRRGLAYGSHQDSSFGPGAGPERRLPVHRRHGDRMLRPTTSGDADMEAAFGMEQTATSPMSAVASRAGASRTSASAAPRSPGDAISYANCPRCGLAVRLRATFLTLRHCPRCVARRGIAVEMFTSKLRVLPSPSRQPDGGAAQRCIHQVRDTTQSHEPVGEG